MQLPQPISTRSSYYEPVEPSKYLNYLGQEILKAINPEEIIRASYWKCFCCFCPTILKSTVTSTSPILALKNRILNVFQKSLEHQAIQYSNSGIIIRDNKGHLIDCNRAYLRLVGYRKSELIENPLLQPIVLHENMMPVSYTPDTQTNYQTHVVCKNGDIKQGTVSILTLTSDDGRIICQLKQFDEDLALQFRESEERILSHCAATSHEIRTTLTGILGGLSYLIDTPLNEQEIKAIYLSMVDLGNHILELLDNDLNYSELMEGRHKFNYASFRLKHLIKKIYSTYSEKLKPKPNKIHLSFNIGENIPENIIGDQRCIWQVLASILSNSVKYVETGFISIKITNMTNVSRQYAVDNPCEMFLQFEISDSRPTIPALTLKNFFTSYSQGKKTKKNAGLNLILAKLFIEAMGGKMFPIKSPLQDGRGSLFSFYIKVKKDQNHPLLAAKKLSASPDFSPITPQQSDLNILFAHLNGVKVLIVDDVPLILKSLQNILKQVEMSVTTAQSGEEALAIIQKDPNFDIVIMDVEMDGKSGPETAQIIRETISKTLPIIAFTGNTSIKVKNECISSGMNAVAIKGMDKITLYKMISSNLIKKITNLSKNRPHPIALPPMSRQLRAILHVDEINSQDPE